MLTRTPPTKLTDMKVAIISTAVLPTSDLPHLLYPDASLHCFNHDDEAASIFYVPDVEEDTTVEEAEYEWRALGLSEAFIALMRQARAEGYHYVCFEYDARREREENARRQIPVDGVDFHLEEPYVPVERFRPDEVSCFNPWYRAYIVAHNYVIPVHRGDLYSAWLLEQRIEYFREFPDRMDCRDCKTPEQQARCRWSSERRSQQFTDWLLAKHNTPSYPGDVIPK